MNKLFNYLPKMISVKYNFNDYIDELIRDKVPTGVRQDVARELHQSGGKPEDVKLAVRSAYKLVKSGNIATYKLVTPA